MLVSRGVVIIMNRYLHRVDLSDDTEMTALESSTGIGYPGPQAVRKLDLPLSLTTVVCRKKIAVEQGSKLL